MLIAFWHGSNLCQGGGAVLIAAFNSWPAVANFLLFSTDFLYKEPILLVPSLLLSLPQCPEVKQLKRLSPRKIPQLPSLYDM